VWLDHDRGDDLLHPVATWTAPEHDAVVRVPAALPSGAGLAGSSCQAGEAIWVPDAGVDPRPLSAASAAAGHLGAGLAVPIRCGERSVGALTLFTAAAKPREDSCVALITVIAAHIGEFVQRRRAEHLATQLTQARDEYVALVGHELRTPLTSIAAYTDLIGDSADDTPLRDLRGLLDVIHRNSTQLRGIVDDLLDLAALDAGHAAVPAETFDLAALVRHAVDELAPAAAARRLGVHVGAPPRLPFTGVEQRLRQLVDNLLSNAVNYSPDGGEVTVTLGVVHDPAPAVELTVSDTGIGIPADEREHVFRRFYRSTRARDRGIPGTGLGLALCRIVTDLHHGTIAITGTDGNEGTTFLVRLPAATPS
jgi:signal transduction histidine kinase